MKTLTVFTATWCAPCKAISPILDTLAIPVRRVDIEDRPTLAALYGIRSIPAFVLCEGDQIIANKTGIKTLAELQEFIAQTAPSAQPA